MSLHFPLPKIRTFRFSLHTSRLSLHGEVTIVALKFAMSSHFPLPKNFSPLCSPSFKWHEPCDEWSKTQDKWSNPAQSYIVREVRSVRERERERDTDGSDVIIVVLKLAMSLQFPMPKLRTIAVSSHFPLPKIPTFRFSLYTSRLSSFLKWSPVWRWNSQWVYTFRCQKNSPSLFGLSLEWRELRDEWSKTQDKWSNSAQSYCSSHRKNESN